MMGGLFSFGLISIRSFGLFTRGEYQFQFCDLVPQVAFARNQPISCHWMVTQTVEYYFARNFRFLEPKVVSFLQSNKTFLPSISRNSRLPKPIYFSIGGSQNRNSTENSVRTVTVNLVQKYKQRWAVLNPIWNQVRLPWNIFNNRATKEKDVLTEQTAINDLFSLSL